MPAGAVAEPGAAGSGLVGNGPHMFGGKKFWLEKVIRFSESSTTLLELPPFSRRAVSSSCQNDSTVRTPRSRQISARTSPIERSRSWAAISFEVGRLARTESAFFASWGVARVRGLRAAGAELAGTLRTRVVRLHRQCGFERRGHAQTARDAREDEGDVFGAEANRDPEDGQRGGAPA